MDYTTVFLKRCKSYVSAMKKYPHVMKEEFQVAASILNSSEPTTVINIPAGCVELQEYLSPTIQYFPYEIEPVFANLVQQPVCKLNSIPHESNSVDKVISIAALHHASQNERISFYRECNRILKKGGELIVADVIQNSEQDAWLNSFVDSNNPLGHKGIFWTEADKEYIESCGYEVHTEVKDYNWIFTNREEMINFCRELFFLENVTDESIDNALTNLLHATNTIMPWKLLYFIAKKKTFSKPDNWSSLQLYQKISYYKTILSSEHAFFVDKLNVKEFIHQQTNGRCKVGEVVKILDSYEDICEADLQEGTVIKTTHASGWNIFVTPRMNIVKVKERLKSWNTVYIGNNEQHYKYIPPRFFIEKRIHDYKYGYTQKAVTFMFRCIHGQPISINVRDFSKETPYSSDAMQNNYRMDGTLIEKAKFPFEFPPEVPTMIELAKLLSKPFEFVRVDFYLDSKRDIYFSEFTFTPSGGIPFYPTPLEIEFGKMWI